MRDAPGWERREEERRPPAAVSATETVRDLLWRREERSAARVAREGGGKVELEDEVVLAVVGVLEDEDGWLTGASQDMLAVVVWICLVDGAASADGRWAAVLLIM